MTTESPPKEAGSPRGTSDRQTKLCACGKALNPNIAGLLCWRCRESRQERVNVTCTECGKTFTRLKAQVDRAAREGRTTVLCSLTCRQTFFNRTNPNPRGVQRKCEVCGVEVPERAKKGRVFCGKECRAKAKERKLRTCPECRLVFEYTSHRTQYCTRECADRAHSKRMQGASNSHFRPGTSYNNLHRRMRQLILERDVGCVVCGLAQELSMHHVDGVPTHNRPENLVMLCRSCHMIHHKSSVSPFAELSQIATKRSESMTSTWKEAVASLLTAFSYTTV